MTDTTKDVEGLLADFEAAVDSMACSEDSKQTRAEIEEARGAVLDQFRTLRSEVERLRGELEIAGRAFDTADERAERAEGAIEKHTLASVGDVLQVVARAERAEARCAELEALVDEVMSHDGHSATGSCLSHILRVARPLATREEAPDER